MQELLDLVIYKFGIVDIRIVPCTRDPHKGNALDFTPLLIERAHVTCPIILAAEQKGRTIDGVWPARVDRIGKHEIPMSGKLSIFPSSITLHHDAHLSATVRSCCRAEGAPTPEQSPGNRQVHALRVAKGGYFPLWVIGVLERRRID